MGVHFYSGIPNPVFMRKPIQLLSSSFPPHPPVEFLPLSERLGYFALSIISDCNAPSLRDAYLRTLVSILGSDNVHEYGKCGNRKLPPKPIINAAKMIAKYKFFFSFENTIQSGYVTEKLFFTLNLPVIPVYYGAPNVPNVTVIPSFIKVADFHSPKQLANYLLHLAENEEESMAYHRWRKDPKLFSKDYLDIISKRLAGPEELKVYQDKNVLRFPRAAQCCRLCDENYVRYAMESRTDESLINGRMGERDVKKKFFG